MRPRAISALTSLGDAMTAAMLRFVESFRREMELLQLPTLVSPRDMQFVPMVRQGRVSGVRAAKRSALKRRNQRRHQGKGRIRG